MCILGKTGSGKSALLLEMILDKIIDYDVLYIVSPTIFQPEYQLMINGSNAGLTTEHITSIFKYQN